MSIQSLTSTVQRLQASVDTLAALGAELRIRREGLPADPRIGQQLQAVVRALDPTLLDGVTHEQEETALSIIQSTMRQAMDLLENPARSPGWSYEDPEILQGQGKTSRRFVHAIHLLAQNRPDLQRVVQEPGTLLDVGTGVGWFAIEAVRTWPAVRCLGIDIWEQSLRLARANLAGTGTEDRIELRAQSVLDLEEQGTFALGWFPAAFMPAEIVPTALERIRNGLKPGGWLVFSMFAAPRDALGHALTGLKFARYGAHPWSHTEAEGQLRGLGFECIETWFPDPASIFVVGRKPFSLAPKA